MFSIRMKVKILFVVALNVIVISSYGQSNWDEWKKRQNQKWEDAKEGKSSQQNTNSSQQNTSSPLNSPSTSSSYIPAYPDTKIWAVVVGVARYADERNNLIYTKDDAYRVWAYLKSAEGGNVPDNQIRLLVDEDATRNEIITAMKEVYSNADNNDIVMLYFSGHGKVGAFLPHDYSMPNSNVSSCPYTQVNNSKREILHNEVSQIFNSSSAKYKICVADACYSGSLKKGVKSSPSEINMMTENWYAALEQAKGGLSLFMSSSENETSLEKPSLRQGLFTYHFLSGLKGEADENRDRIITLEELFSYTRENVSAGSQGKQNPSINIEYDKKMPIGMVRNK